MAARDYVLHEANHNPYRDGTPEHDQYNASFEKTAKELQKCRALENTINQERNPNG